MRYIGKGGKPSEGGKENRNLLLWVMSTEMKNSKPGGVVYDVIFDVITFHSVTRHVHNNLWLINAHFNPA